MPAYVAYPLDREGDQVSRAAPDHQHLLLCANKLHGGPRSVARARGADRPLRISYRSNRLQVSEFPACQSGSAGSHQSDRPERTSMMHINPGLGNALLNSASDAIIATDYDGRITFWNPGAERVSRFTTEETVGQFAPSDHSRKDCARGTGAAIATP